MCESIAIFGRLRGGGSRINSKSIAVTNPRRRKRKGGGKKEERRGRKKRLLGGERESQQPPPLSPPFLRGGGMEFAVAARAGTNQEATNKRRGVYYEKYR